MSWRLRQLYLVGMLVLLVTACATGGNQPVATVAPATTPAAQLETPDTNDILQLIIWVAPTGLNPYINPSIHDFYASRITYEPLASFDKDGQLIPFLAADIPTSENGGLAADGMSVTWKLKQDVQWSDGQPFTAADIRFTYDYITNPAISSHAAAAYTSVDSIEIVDDYTIRVNFKAPEPAWAVPFVGRYGLILPQHVFEQYNGENYADAPANKLPVGTGPYRVVAFSPQEVLFLGDKLVETNRVTYEPNYYFHGPEQPAFNRVELRGWGLPELSAQSVLESNTADYVYDLRLHTGAIAELEALGQGQATVNFGSQVLLIELNSSDPRQPSGALPHPIFSDQRVRQAMAYALDRAEIARSVYGQAARPTSNVVVMPEEYQSENTTTTFDLAQARQLLGSAGWTDTNGDGIREKNGTPLAVTYQYSTAPLETDTPDIVKQRLEAVGFAVELIALDSGTLVSSDQQSPAGEEPFIADMRQYLAASATPDPLLYLGRWTCDQVPDPDNNNRGANVIRWCNATYESLYTQARTERDREQRRQLILQMNDLLVTDGFVIPVVQVANVFGLSNSIEGMEWTPWDAEVWTISKWRRRY